MLTKKKFTPEQERFIQKFIDLAYETMAIEGEAVFSKREMYRRYRQDAIDLVIDGTYKKVHF